MDLLAIDFETADHGPDSACAIGLVRVSRGRVVSVTHHLIKPPRETFAFSHIHGISWDDVRSQPDFGALWPEIKEQFEGVEYFLAHNASFDCKVLRACCQRYDLPIPEKPFVCTVQVARTGWSIYPTRLPNVCEFLKIELEHHNAASDALACAQIAISALSTGIALNKCVLDSRTKTRLPKKAITNPPTLVTAPRGAFPERPIEPSRKSKDHTQSRNASIVVAGIFILMVVIWLLS